MSSSYVKTDKTLSNLSFPVIFESILQAVKMFHQVLHSQATKLTNGLLCYKHSTGEIIESQLTW